MYAHKTVLKYRKIILALPPFPPIFATFVHFSNGQYRKKQILSFFSKASAKLDRPYFYIFVEYRLTFPPPVGKIVYGKVYAEAVWAAARFMITGKKPGFTRQIGSGIFPQCALGRKICIFPAITAVCQYNCIGHFSRPPLQLLPILMKEVRQRHYGF